MLGLDSKPDGLLLVQSVLGPKLLERFEPKVAAKRFLDYFAVALPLPSGANLDQTHDFFVER